MHALDNVIWNALTTRQAEFAESHAEARRFAPEVTQLAGFNAPTDAGYASLKGLLADRGTLALFLAEPYQARAGCELAASGSVWQMVCENGNGLSPSADDSEFELIELGVADSPEMIELTALTKPGPFGKRTHELGTYLGIRRDGKLVAMAGERLKVLAFTEVSAVCTHPQHAGHGYARVLMMEVMRRIRERGETPFLHVREDNARAIALYERIGFRRRVVSHLAVLRRVAAEEYSVTRQ
ncbi:MAG TPA: GNAT family N-acetyltransferase [Candidatus Acidoferrum sp.]|nr:GNAT family N-acetyltransferase [Candidatus Acidoferrum sp.]